MSLWRYRRILNIAVWIFGVENIQIFISDEPDPRKKSWNHVNIFILWNIQQLGVRFNLFNKSLVSVTNLNELRCNLISPGTDVPLNQSEMVSQLLVMRFCLTGSAADSWDVDPAAAAQRRWIHVNLIIPELHESSWMFHQSRVIRDREAGTQLVNMHIFVHDYVSTSASDVESWCAWWGFLSVSCITQTQRNFMSKCKLELSLLPRLQNPLKLLIMESINMLETPPGLSKDIYRWNISLQKVLVYKTKIHIVYLHQYGPVLIQLVVLLISPYLWRADIIHPSFFH